MTTTKLSELSSEAVKPSPQNEPPYSQDVRSYQAELRRLTEQSDKAIQIAIGYVMSLFSLNHLTISEDDVVTFAASHVVECVRSDEGVLTYTSTRKQ